jgi:multiple sugar transport system permease protein
VLHVALAVVGVDTAPSALASSEVLGISWWEWAAGPSVAMSAYIMMAIFTTSGTFMLLFIAALQNMGPEIQEAALMDRANPWQRFRYVTLPMLRPTLFTVLTLGLIGTWQVFDQIYTGTRGGPAKTTLTPAYLSFHAAFNQQDWGEGAAIAFLLFAIIVFFTLVQRWVLRDKDAVSTRGRKARAVAAEVKR